VLSHSQIHRPARVLGEAVEHAFERELAAALLVAAVGLPGAWLRPWLVCTQLRLACQTLRLGNSNLGRILPGSE
jgi:hypothetical protein